MLYLNVLVPFRVETWAKQTRRDPIGSFILEDIKNHKDTVKYKAVEGLIYTKMDDKLYVPEIRREEIMINIHDTILQHAGFRDTLENIQRDYF